MNEQQITQLERLSKLRQEGAITNEEFEQQKQALFTFSPPKPNPSKPNKIKLTLFEKVLVFSLAAFLFLAGVGAFDSPPPPKTRKEVIETFFSPFDGSHRGVEQYLKSAIDDPDSYKHVNTRYIDNGWTITVYTTFSQKNEYDATVKRVARSTIDGKDGHFISYDGLE